MRSIFLILAFFFASDLSSHEAHKFYVSITKIEFVQEQNSLQLITKIFTDDLEAVLRERYGMEELYLDSNKETEAVTKLIERYVMQKIEVKVDGKALPMVYLGREYDNDVVKCYLEFEGLDAMDRIEVTNKVLLDMFDEQQNIIHIKREKERKSMVLEKEHPTGVLNFN